MLIGIITALLLLSFFLKYRKFKQAAPTTQKYKTTADPTIPDMPLGFGYKCIWFAIRTADKAKVAAMLGLQDILDCNWEAGIKQAYHNNAVFITPAINGWTLACGWGLPIDTDEIKILLRELSQEFGEAQYFATHRVTGFHCWMKAANGQIQRAYAYLGESGETLVVEGEPTEIEKTFNLMDTSSVEVQDPYFDQEDITWPDEDLVMEIATSWSINPCELENRNDITPGLGLIGKWK